MTEQQSTRTPEEEIKHLEEKILEKRKELETKSSREVVHETLEEHIREETQTTRLPVPKTGALDDSSGQDTDTTQNHIDELVALAFKKGVVAAIKEARNSHNPYIIDALHDALTDHFVKALESKGLLSTHD